MFTPRRSNLPMILSLSAIAVLLISCPLTTLAAEDDKPACRGEGDAAKKDKKPDPYAWKDLFDGKTLKGWKVPDYAGKGEDHVKDGVIVLEMGAEMTGISYAGKIPRENYEVEWEGARLNGFDFFAACTFPVGKQECSFVTGGWGGMVVGISAVDEYYADDNLTTKFHDFKDKQFYKFRARVTPEKVKVWIGKEQVVDVPRKDHKLSIHYAMELYRPLGFSAWVTKGGVKNIRIRKLKPCELKEPKEKK